MSNVECRVLQIRDGHKLFAVIWGWVDIAAVFRSIWCSSFGHGSRRPEAVAMIRRYLELKLGLKAEGLVSSKRLRVAASRRH